MDQDNWQRFRCGDKEAFRALYDRHIDRLFGYGMKLTKDRGITLECIQSLFVNLWEKRLTLTCPANIGGYLLTSLRHAAFKALKERARMSTNSTELANISNTKDYAFDMDIDLEATMRINEVSRERLIAFIESKRALSAQQREVIYLRYFKNMSVTDVATVLGITNQTVRNVAHIALTKLRNNKFLTEIMQHALTESYTEA